MVVKENTNLRHYRLPISIFDIAEWHLRTFVLVDTYFWIVDVRDLVQSDCPNYEKVEGQNEGDISL